MATINHKTYNEATETFKDFNVYDGKETLIFKVDGSAGRVGIGTSAPANALVVVSNDPSQVSVEASAGNTNSQINLKPSGTGIAFIKNQENTDFALGVNNTEQMRITTTGNVGIGTASPTGKLHTILPAYTNEDTDSQQAIFGESSGYGVRIGYNVTSNAGYITALKPAVAWGNLVLQGSDIRMNPNGLEVARFTSNGLTFNGDTAAANALDDYEEGTWTPLLRGAATAGTYELGDTYAVYTKIGRQVTASMLIQLASSITGGGTGYAVIYGLPFLKMNNSQFQGVCTFEGVTYTGDIVTTEFTSYSSTAVIYFRQSTSNASGSDVLISAFAADNLVKMTITYFV